MGVVNSKVHLSQQELKYKTICQNTYVEDIPIGCWAVKDLTWMIKLKSENYNFNVTDDYGKTPLHYAVDYPDSFFLLLETNVYLYQTDLEGNTPLHYAVLTDNTRLIKPLMRSIITKNNAGYSPFHLAVRNSKYDNVCFIINNIKDSLFFKKDYLINDFRDSKNMSIVENAIFNNDIKMLTLLKDFIDIKKAKAYLTQHGKKDYDSALKIMNLLL